MPAGKVRRGVADQDEERGLQTPKRPLIASVVSYFKAHYRPPPSGGRYRNPEFTEVKLIPFSEATVRRLRLIADHVTEEVGFKVYPYQVAAVLLELSMAKT